MEKLVRDRIPEYMKGPVSYRIADASELPELLMRKLREEAAELLATEPGSPEEVEEAADVAAVAQTMLYGLGGTIRPDVVNVEAKKHGARGGFTGGVVLQIPDVEI